MRPLQINGPRVLHINNKVLRRHVFGNLHQIKHGIAYLLGTVDFALTWHCSPQQPFEPNLSRPERQLIVDGVQCNFLFLDVASLPDPNVIVIFLQGVNPNLFFLLADNFRLLLNKINILEQLHLLVHDLQPQTSPHLTCNADIVDPPTNCINIHVLNLTLNCSSQGR